MVIWTSVTPGTWRRVVLTVDAHEDAGAAGSGTMSTPDAPSAPRGAQRPAQGVGDHELLERSARGERQASASTGRRWCAPPPRSPTPGRSCTRTSAWTGPSTSPRAAAAAAVADSTAAVSAGAEARRGHVDRLLERRAVERVGLVEHGQDAQLARRRAAPPRPPPVPARIARRAGARRGRRPAAGGDAPDAVGDRDGLLGVCRPAAPPGCPTTSWA